MKKLLINTIFLFGILFMISSCEEKELVVLNSEANTTVTLTPSTVVLLEENAEKAATTISWTEPDYGYDAAASYTIQLDKKGGDFSAAQTLAVGNVLSKDLLVSELNAKLLSLGVTPGTATQVDVRVQIKLSNYSIKYSPVVTMTVTAYSTLLNLSTNWGVVGSATPGSWGSTPTTPIKDIPFWTTSTAGVYVAYGTVRTGEVKFRLDNAWTTNYGGSGMNGSLVQNGSNIAITAGTYKFTVNTNDMTYTIIPYTWGIVGDATPNGWGAPDSKLYYNSYADDWRTIVTLKDGAIKFRFNEDWAVNYGDNGVNGTLDLGGDNIAVTAGNYLVIFDPVKLTYSLEKVDAWGLVGSATPKGWDGPDTKFIPDFGINEGTYYINGITLTAGEIKVRQNDAWGTNYGDTGNNGSLELNGDNIPVTAGTYNIVVNFAATPPTIAINPWQ